MRAQRYTHLRVRPPWPLSAADIFQGRNHATEVVREIASPRASTFFRAAALLPRVYFLFPALGEANLLRVYTYTRARVCTRAWSGDQSGR